MGDYYFDKDQGRSSASAVGTNAGVSATIAASTGYKWLVTGIQVSGDAAALITIESPSGTTIWRKRQSAAFASDTAFPLGVVVGATDQAVLVKVSASTSNSEANIQAIKIKN